MRGGPTHLADAVVRRWVWLYTVGMASDGRDHRRMLIESDLWEHREDARAEGEATRVTTLSILGRWAAGIPADLSWRVSQRGGQYMKENTVMETLGRYWWRALALLTAAATVYMGFRQFFTDDVSSGVSVGKVVALAFFLLAGLLTVTGLAIQRATPRRGAQLVIIGVLPAALIGGFGLGIVVGLVAALVADFGWWWVPVGIASAVATAAGIGGLNAWWHAAPAGTPTLRAHRMPIVPLGIVIVGVTAIAIGLGIGWFTVPTVIFGAGVVVLGARLWSQRIKPAAERVIDRH